MQAARLRNDYVARGTTVDFDIAATLTLAAIVLFVYAVKALRVLDDLL